MKILDATAGNKTMWYQKKHPFVVFMDIRQGKIKDPRPDRYNYFNFNPDVLAEWQHIPFKNEVFDMVVFDPPHIFKNRDTKEGILEVRYSQFFNDNWHNILSCGIRELFRVLKSEGVFVFKWCDSYKKLEDILKLFPYPPMFGTRTGQRNKTHWVVFIKFRLEKPLDEFFNLNHNY